MFDIAQFDTTPVSDAPQVLSLSVQWRETEFTERALKRRFEPMQPTPLSHGQPAYRLTDTSMAATPAQGRAETMALPPRVMQPQTALQTDTERTVSARGVLLAQKYGGGKIGREQESRLEILTARLRNMSPRVDDAEMDALTEIVVSMENCAVEVDRIRERLSRI